METTTQALEYFDVDLMSDTITAPVQSMQSFMKSLQRRRREKCIPGPPATYPPISPEYLASLFTCPTDVHEEDTWILDQLPKRTCGELAGQIGVPAEGWGIYY
jgi:hypothetical protein